MAIVSLPYLYLQLGIQSGDNARYSQFLRQAERVALRYTRRHTFSHGSWTRFHDGNNTEILQLQCIPVTSITNIWLDADGYYGQGQNTPFSSDRLLEAGVDYALVVDGENGISKCGHVRRLNGVWDGRVRRKRDNLYVSAQSGAGNIKVSYDGGYTDEMMPEDLKMAICGIVASISQTAAIGLPVTSESFEYYSYQVAGSQDLSNRMEYSRNVLNAYKEVWL